MHTASFKIMDPYTGPLILKEGLRPFFLAANLWATLCVMLWVAVLAGYVSGPESIGALEWHKHELLFGYTSAVIGGFLLTVSANWTGRTPVRGNALLALVLLWALGRFVMWFSGSLPSAFVALVDLSFPFALVAVVGRELILGNNYRNLRVLAVLMLFTFANGVFHYELMLGGGPRIGSRLGLSAALILIMLVGGRIIPAFTRNWLIKRKAARLPKPFGAYDIATLIVSFIVLLAWSITGESEPLAWAMLLAALLNLGRLVRWCGEKTVQDPLVFILHLAYAFIPLGFFAMAATELWTTPITLSAATHIWTTGAVAVTCMAVMTRAGLGHTAQELTVSPSIVVIYVSLISSVVFRFLASLAPNYMALIQASAGLWCFAHITFVFRYAKLFLTTR